MSYLPPNAKDPGQPRVILNILPALEKAGYTHTSGMYEGRPNISALYLQTNITYARLTDFIHHPNRVEGLSLHGLAKLCEALDCTPGDLLTYQAPSAVPELAVESYFRENPLGQAPPEIRTPKPTPGRVTARRNNPNTPPIPGWMRGVIVKKKAQP